MDGQRDSERQRQGEAEEITAQETGDSSACSHERLLLLGFLKAPLNLELVHSCLCPLPHNVGEGRARQERRSQSSHQKPPPAPVLPPAAPQV